MKIYDSDQIQNMLTNESQIHQFLFWISSTDEWAELKQKHKNCCFMKSDIQQSLKSTDEQKHVINSHQVHCSVSTNQWRFLSQSSFMISTIKCSTKLLICCFCIFEFAHLYTQFHEYQCCSHTICFCQIRWTKNLSHKKWIFWLWSKKTLS